MDLAVNTCFLSASGSPERALKAVAEAGFTHLHWCHHWRTDFLYGPAELKQCAQWLRSFELRLLDVHGSAGQEKCWYSPVEYQRQAGVELVVNRVIMLRELEGTGSLIMHVPLLRDREGFDSALPLRQFDALRRSLDELTPVLEKYGARIAVENGFSDTFELIGRIMRDYPEKCFGITYDSGHGNVAEGKGMERLMPFKNRLQAVHLNDNDGSGDQHQPPFYGTVDWERMAELIAESSYQDRPLSFEILIGHTPFCDPQAPEQRPENVRAFLKDARERCERVAKLFAEKLTAKENPAI